MQNEIPTRSLPFVPPPTVLVHSTKTKKKKKQIEPPHARRSPRPHARRFPPEAPSYLSFSPTRRRPLRQRRFPPESPSDLSFLLPTPSDSLPLDEAPSDPKTRGPKGLHCTFFYSAISTLLGCRTKGIEYLKERCFPNCHSED